MKNIDAFTDEAGSTSMKRLAILGILVFLASLQTGCATIVHGRSQRIGISSTPTGADVLINGKPHGTTPTFVSLYRKQRNVVTVRKDGYLLSETALTNLRNRAVWGNLFFFPYGFVIDTISGAGYTLEPGQVQINLTLREEKNEGDGDKKQHKETGTIIVSANVAEVAEVFVDGMFVGNSPSKLKLNEGIHIIEVKASGYQTYRRHLLVMAGSEVPLRAVLERSP